MPLTDRTIRSLKVQARPFKRFDERGLFLHVQPSGSRYWRLKYRFGDKELLLALGVYPDVSLKMARERRDAARRLIAEGIDPNEEKSAQKRSRSDSFEVVAREWFAKEEPGWAPSHATKIIRRLERDVFPYLGSSSVSDIEAPAVLAVARRISDRGASEGRLVGAS